MMVGVASLIVINRVLDVVTLAIHRIYETDIPEGHRVLIDRLWPRGVKKSDARLDEWLKDVAPSTELRRWYDHEVDRFEEFARRYHNELDRSPGVDAVAHLMDLTQEGEVILLTATKDVEHSGARVLLDHLIARSV